MYIKTRPFARTMFEFVHVSYSNYQFNSLHQFNWYVRSKNNTENIYLGYSNFLHNSFIRVFHYFHVLYCYRADILSYPEIQFNQ